MSRDTRMRLLFHLPVPISADSLHGTTGRVLGLLRLFHERGDEFAVDVLAGNLFGGGAWTAARCDEVLEFADRIFLYRGEASTWDAIHSRGQSLFHQRIMRRQLPVDSDYFAPPGYVRFVKELVGREAYDCIWINTLDSAHLASRLSDPGLLRVIDIHDITSRFRLVRKEIDYSKNLKFDYEANFARELRLLDRFDRVVVDSRYERDVLAERLRPQKLHFLRSRVTGLPPVVTPYSDRDLDIDVLFVGADNQPNRLAVDFFISKVLPGVLERRPGIKVVIAGRVSKGVELDSHTSRNVSLLGYVPDLADLYLRSRVSICPLTSGAGTKFKLVEAMGYGMPAVVTTHSASALSLVDGLNCFIADEPGLYAERVVALMEDPGLAERLSVAVLETFEAEHSTRAIAEEVDAILEGRGRR